MKVAVMFLVLLIAMGAFFASGETVMAQEICFPLSFYPLFVELCHDGTVVRIEDTEYGPQEVYEIHSVKFENFTTSPRRLRALDGSGNEWTTIITPSESGERNIATPQRFESFPLSFWFTLVSN